MSCIRRVSAVLGLLSTIFPCFAQTTKVDAALLQSAGPHPIFVRMSDQLFADGAAFETFINDAANDKRSLVRARSVAALQSKAAHARTQTATLLQELTAAKDLAQVQHFWIINGFAASASRRAIEQLAACDAVAYVHLQTQPGGKLHQRRSRSKSWLEARRADLETAEAQRAAAPSTAFEPAKHQIAWNLERIHAREAWEKGANGSGVVIALLDTGVLAIPPLTRALWRNPGEVANGKDDDQNGYVDDLFGWDFEGDSPYVIGDGDTSHGTMCGGILAGREYGEPSTVTGVAPRASLMVLRGMGDLRAYEYAALAGADVLSMSYMWINVELGSFRSVYRTAHEHLAACGIVAVGGAGNFGRNAPEGKQIALPKDIPIVIAAAGIEENGSAPEFSSRGPVAWDGVPFFAAAYESVRTKPDVTGCIGGYPVWHWTRGPRGREAKVNWEDPANPGTGLITGPRGNSFSGPHAGGVAALMLSVQPELTPWRLKALLEASCEDLGEPGRDLRYGAGLLRADRAITPLSIK